MNDINKYKDDLINLIVKEKLVNDKFDILVYPLRFYQNGVERSVKFLVYILENEIKKLYNLEFVLYKNYKDNTVCCLNNVKTLCEYLTIPFDKVFNVLDAFQNYFSRIPFNEVYKSIK